MSRLSKILAFAVLLVFLLACNFATQPFRDAQNLAETAQSVTTMIPFETLQALPSMLPTVISAETLQAFPSAVPTFEALATQFGNIFDPQGTPVQEWKGIPIMSQATAGQEFSEPDSYSFKANVSSQEVQDFYTTQLANLGWESLSGSPNAADNMFMMFQKDNSFLTITVISSEGSVVVNLILA